MFAWKNPKCKRVVYGMTWKRIPKATHIGINNLSLGVYDAIAYFNYGMKATLDVFKMLNIEPGIYTMQICDNLNKERKRNALYKISDKYKKRRKPIRHLSKQKQGKNIEVGGTSYEAGSF